MVLCQFANAHRKKDQSAIEPYRFHPYAEKPKTKARQATQADLDMLFGGPPQ